MKLSRLGIAVGFIGYLLGVSTAAGTTCSAYPYTLTNGTTADATQVMADFTSILTCANGALAPLANPQFTGLVGIGSTSPAAPLDIVGQVSPWVGIKIEDANPSTYPEAMFIGQVANLYSYVGSGEYKISTTWVSPYTTAANVRFNNDGSIAFTTDTGLTAGVAYSPTTRVTIATTGNVGIGTTSPSGNLDIETASGTLTSSIVLGANGATYGKYYITRKDDLSGWGYSDYVETYGGLQTRWSYSGGSSAAMLLTALPSTGARLFLYDGSNNAAIYFNTMGSSYIAGGNVGVGTTSPATALDVVGTIRQTNCTSASLSANGSGDIICTSDARLKNVLGDYTSGLEALTHITPKLFTYKPTKADPVETFVHAGFIAQDVMSVIPQASALQHDGFYSLDTTAVLAATVNSVKQLKILADRQAAEIAQLNRVNAILAASLREQSVVLRSIEAHWAAVERQSRMRTAHN